MYQAICPDCGATITLNVPGDIWAGCPSCEFYGQVPALEPTRNERLARALAAVRLLTVPGVMAPEAADAIQDVLAEVERLRVENAGLQRRTEEATTYRADLMWRYHRLREIVRVVAEADNSDSSVCYQLCSYDLAWADDEHQVMTHNTPCVSEQARALLATSESEVSE